MPSWAVVWPKHKVHCWKKHVLSGAAYAAPSVESIVRHAKEEQDGYKLDVVQCLTQSCTQRVSHIANDDCSTVHGMHLHAAVYRTSSSAASS